MIPIAQKDIAPCRKVCRNLFGTVVNHEDLIREATEANNERLRKKKEEYNFDFAAGKPLPGRYCWQRIVEDNNCDAKSQKDDDEKVEELITSSDTMKERTIRKRFSTETKLTGKFEKLH